MSNDETERTWIYPLLNFEASTEDDNPSLALVNVTTAAGTVTYIVTTAQLDRIAEECVKATSARGSTSMRAASQ